MRGSGLSYNPNYEFWRKCGDNVGMVVVQMHEDTYLDGSKVGTDMRGTIGKGGKVRRIGMIPVK